MDNFSLSILFHFPTSGNDLEERDWPSAECPAAKEREVSRSSEPSPAEEERDVSSPCEADP